MKKAPAKRPAKTPAKRKRPAKPKAPPIATTIGMNPLDQQVSAAAVLAAIRGLAAGEKAEQRALRRRR